MARGLHRGMLISIVGSVPVYLICANGGAYRLHAHEVPVVVDAWGVKVTKTRKRRG